MTRNITTKIAAFALIGTAIVGGAIANWAQTFSGFLDPDTSQVYLLTLTPGTYEIAAAGEEALGDLDMSVWEGDRMVVADDLADNEPVVTFEVFRTTTLELEVYNAAGSQRFSGYARQID